MKSNLAGIVVRRPEPSELTAVRHLRLTEMGDGSPLPDPLEPTAEDLSSESIHVAAFDGPEIVGVLRLNPYPQLPGAFLVSRVTVHHDYRQQGIGRQLMLLAEERAASAGATILILDARSIAIRFYERLGYIKSPVRQPDSPGHTPMEKTLSKN